jgi:DHA2 family methylenomycin A resistance protein-like MFS transporter
MGPVAGYLAARFGGRRMATTGMVAVGVSMVMLAALSPGTSYWWILPGLLVSGVGLGLIGPPSVAAVTNEAGSADLGAAGAAVNLGAAFGTSMGIATMQAVLVATSGGANAPGMSAFSAAFLAGGVVTLVGIGATLGLEPPNRVDRALRIRRRAR